MAAPLPFPFRLVFLKIFFYFLGMMNRDVRRYPTAMTADAPILKEYREVFQRYAADGIIDLDVRLKHKFNFRISKVEELMDGLDGVLPPTRLSQYIVTFVQEGQGKKTIGEITFPVESNTLFVIPKSVAHSSTYQPGAIKGYFLSFNLDFFLQTVFPSRHIGRRLFTTTIIPYLVLTNEQALQLTTVFEYLIEEYHGDRVNKAELLAIKTLELLILCDRFFAEAGRITGFKSSSALLEAFRDLVRKQYAQHRSVKFYANALHIHANHLNFIVKKQTGQTAKQIIDEQVLLEAKSLLNSTSLSIKEIAYRLGFEEPDRFSSFFRKHEQRSPTQYKQQYLI
jgi:AraC family transcriptional activator of pobA